MKMKKQILLDFLLFSILDSRILPYVHACPKWKVACIWVGWKTGFDLLAGLMVGWWLAGLVGWWVGGLVLMLWHLRLACLSTFYLQGLVERGHQFA